MCYNHTQDKGNQNPKQLNLFGVFTFLQGTVLSCKFTAKNKTMYKLYLKGNYVFLEILATGQKLTGFAKEVKIIPNSKQRTVYTILNIHGWSESTPLALIDLQKENGVAYTENEWLDFYTVNIGSTSSNISQSTIYSLDRSTVTETLTTGGISQTIVPINSERKGFEFQNQSSNNLILGIGVNPSINNGFLIPAGGTYNTTNTVSTREIKVWGATAGQRFTYIEY